MMVDVDDDGFTYSRLFCLGWSSVYYCFCFSSSPLIFIVLEGHDCIALLF